MLDDSLIHLFCTGRGAGDAVRVIVGGIEPEVQSVSPGLLSARGMFQVTAVVPATAASGAAVRVATVVDSKQS